MRSLPKRVSQSIRLLGNCLLQRMSIPPKLLCKAERIYARLFPPTHFVTGPMHFAMMSAAQRDNKFIADLAA